MHILPSWMTGRWSANCSRLDGKNRPACWVRCAARGFPDAAVLLRTLLVHLAGGCSLKEAVTCAQQAGWCDVSAVALFQRLRAAEQWLRWMADQLWQRHPTPALPRGYRARAIDATTVSRPGSRGTDWRVHFGVNLEDLQCDFFEVTDVRGGETFQRIPVAAGDLLLGDRCYGTPPGIAHVAAAGGHVLVRVNQRSLPLFHVEGEPFRLVDGTACHAGGPDPGVADSRPPRWAGLSGAVGGGQTRPLVGRSGATRVAEAGVQEAKEAVADGAVPGGVLPGLDRRAGDGAGGSDGVGLVSLPLAN